MKHSILFSLLVLAAGVGPMAQTTAQDSVHWDFRPRSGQPEVMNDAFLLQDGRLVVVGETEAPGQGKQGLLVILNATTGEELLHKDYGLANDDVLLSGAYAGDGTLYLVGYTQNRLLGEQGWLIRVDAETGEQLFSDDRQGKKGDDRFERIVWMDDSGQGLIAGTSASEADGMIWMLQVDGNQITPQPSVGDGNVGSIVGLEKGPGYVWLCGYTKRKGMGSRGEVWLIKLDKSGGIIYEKKVPKRSGQEVLGMTATIEGELLMAGRVWNTNGDSDVWLGEISKQRQDTVKHAVFGSDSEESSNALFKTPGGNKWLVVYQESSQSTVVQVYNSAFEATLKSQPYRDFKAVRLLWLAKNTYLMLGNVITGKRSNSAIRMMCLNDREDWSDRGDALLEYTGLVFDDDSHDAILAAGERGSIRFSLKNSGAGALADGKIKAKIVSAPAGVSLVTSEISLGFLPPNAPNAYAFPIKASGNTPIGKILIDIIVEVNGQTMLSFPVLLNERQLPPGASASYVRAESGSPGSRVRDVDEKQQTVTLNGYSGKQNIKSSDFKKINNGKVLEDDKGTADLKILPSTVKKDRYEFTMNFTFDLEPGHNVFYVELDDERTEAIDFIYEPSKPNLHLLIIGVPYADLKYTTKDARDFAQTMQTQSANGFFNEVKIDTLLTKEQTTTGEINGHFEELYTRFLEGNIKAKDYLVVFMSGHGIKRENNGKFGLKASDYNSARKGSTTVDYNRLLEDYLNKINCKKVFFIDACHSGASLEDKEGNDDNTARLLVEANATAAGAATFTSCKTNQTSRENSEWQNGAFTEALLEALKGQTVKLLNGAELSPDTGGMPNDQQKNYARDGFISLLELKAFLEKRVPDLVRRQFPDFDQNPVMEISELKPELSLFKIK
jgi:hypothetical protein